MTPRSTLFPYTTLFRSQKDVAKVKASADTKTASAARMAELRLKIADNKIMTDPRAVEIVDSLATKKRATVVSELDRKSTRLNSSHMSISYAVFCLKKKK